MALDAAPVRVIDTANQPQQGGLSGAVPADEADADIPGDGETGAFEHPVPRAVFGEVALVKVVDNDHLAINREAKRTCSIRPMKISTIAQAYR